MLVAAGNPALRGRLTAAVGRAANVEVVGEAADGTETVRLHADLTPDVVLLDVAVPPRGGLGVLRGILAAAPTTCVIVLSDSEHARVVAQCVEGGARGVLRKDRDGIATAAIVLRLLATPNA